MWTWFFIGVVFLIIEGISFGLLSIWFAIGAFVTMFFTYLPIDYQFFIFIVISGISLLLIRKTTIVYLKSKRKEVDRIRKANVKVDNILIRGNERIYIVKLDGKIWESICKNKLEIDEIAQVKEIKGNKLLLIKLEDEILDI
ncbi:Uncharacterised protein [Fusobacterium necrogenes]|uniref:Uncharacterized protein n=1 Tax=Fusobacterium necrogenes TaxID=858 RepID=A0A377GY73_9FUSO|nr:NfeD family protein [Fusobacterium necrogenes]STO31544.1 Uncharacterised protein [Fusobacterium necrogenes]